MFLYVLLVMCITSNVLSTCTFITLVPFMSLENGIRVFYIGVILNNLFYKTLHFNRISSSSFKNIDLSKYLISNFFFFFSK